MSKRVYSEDETTAILRRVAELQHQRENRSNSAGLTLDELEAVAKEAGLDPALLRQAAAEVELTHSAIKSESSTTSTHILHERALPFRVSEEAWTELVFELNERFQSDIASMMGGPGQRVEQIGDSYQWKSTSMSGVETRISLRRRTDETHLKVSQRVGISSSEVEAVGLAFTLAFVVSAIAGAAASSLVYGILAFLLVTVVSTPLIYLADKKWRGKKDRQLLDLTEDAVQILTTFSAEKIPAEGSTAVDTTPVDITAIDSGTETKSNSVDDTAGSDLMKDFDAYTGAPSSSDTRETSTRQDTR